MVNIEDEDMPFHKHCKTNCDKENERLRIMADFITYSFHYRFNLFFPKNMGFKKFAHLIFSNQFSKST